MKRIASAGLLALLLVEASQAGVHAQPHSSVTQEQMMGGLTPPTTTAPLPPTRAGTVSPTSPKPQFAQAIGNTPIVTDAIKPVPVQTVPIPRATVRHRREQPNQRTRPSRRQSLRRWSIPGSRRNSHPYWVRRRLNAGQLRS